MRKTILLPIIALLAIMMAGLAIAVSTFNYPTSSSTIGGSVIFNVTCGLTNSTNATITGTSASTADTFTVVLYNSSAGDTRNNTNATVLTTDMIDALDWTFTGTCYNGSTAADSETITSITSVTVDNTVPGCIFNTALTSNTKYAPTQTWTVNCHNATSATIQFGSNSVLAMTESSDSCTYTGTKSSVPEGVYPTLQVRTSDGLNSTGCSLNYIEIDLGAPLVAAAAATAAAQGAKAGGVTATGTGGAGTTNNLGFLVIVGLAAMFWYMRKKR